MTKPKVTTKVADKVITSTGAVDVVGKDLSNADSVLTIELTDTKPLFTFSGLWTGKDVRVVERHLGQAYQLHLRQLRRERIDPFKKVTRRTK